jgi:hypothetical protein
MLESANRHQEGAKTAAAVQGDNPFGKTPTFCSKFRVRRTISKFFVHLVPKRMLLAGNWTLLLSSLCSAHSR